MVAGALQMYLCHCCYDNWLSTGVAGQVNLLGLGLGIE